MVYKKLQLLAAILVVALSLVQTPVAAPQTIGTTVQATTQQAIHITEGGIAESAPTVTVVRCEDRLVESPSLRFDIMLNLNCNSLISVLSPIDPAPLVVIDTIQNYTVVATSLPAPPTVRLVLAYHAPAIHTDALTVERSSMPQMPEIKGERIISEVSSYKSIITNLSPVTLGMLRC